MQKCESALRWSRHFFYTREGMVKNSLKPEDLVDVGNVHSPLLQETDIRTLEEITVIQASRQNTGWTANGATVCTCKGKCVNNKCKMQKAGVPCSTKCHTTTADLAGTNLE